MANGRNRQPGSLSKAKKKFILHRCDPGIGKVGSEDDYSFEGHIISLNDTSTPSWSSYADAGRPDPKVMYSQFARSVSIDFLVISVNKEEQDEFYKKMARLGKMTYPIIKPGRGYNAPHIWYKIDELISGIGVITNLNYTWNNESPWIDGKPIYTEVSIGIMVLGDTYGYRPNTRDSVKYFNRKD